MSDIGTPTAPGLLAGPLLTDRLRAAWEAVEAGRSTAAAFDEDRTRYLAIYREVWERALGMDGMPSFTDSLLTELGRYVGCTDLGEVRRRCEQAVAAVAADWNAHVEPADGCSVERYYDRTEHFLYDLMWWHTLRDDASPMAYVLALQFAGQRACTRYLDFGAGVGAGAILFARHGLRVGLADISSTLLEFSRWRLAERGLAAESFDLKTGALPAAAFDFITAMDVFEHLADPVGAVEQLARALVPGGYLYGRFHAEVDADRPQHIVLEFAPTFRRLEELGLREVWRDDWLWGHQVFQRTI